jgi:hypothetical protein
MPTPSSVLLETPPRVRELDRLGDEIAELSSWRRPHCTRSWTRGRPVSGTRSWSTSTPPCWRIPNKRGKRPWKAG